MDLPKQLHDIEARLCIEISRRLVGQNDGGLIDQGAGHGHPLSLSTRELVGTVIHSVGEPHHVQNLFCTLFSFAFGYTGINKRQCDIFQSGGPRQKIEGLKDKADLHIADVCQFIVVQLSNIGAIQLIRAACGGVQATDQIHQGAFSASGRPHKGYIFISGDLKVDAFEYFDHFCSERKVPGDSAKCDDVLGVRHCTQM